MKKVAVIDNSILKNNKLKMRIKSEDGKVSIDKVLLSEKNYEDILKGIDSNLNYEKNNHPTVYKVVDIADSSVDVLLFISMVGLFGYTAVGVSIDDFYMAMGSSAIISGLVIGATRRVSELKKCSRDIKSMAYDKGWAKTKVKE